MSQTIFRRKLSRDFTTLPNATLRDSRLSFRARGLLVMVLSNTDDWIVYRGWLEKQTTEGREAIASAINELKSLGYVTCHSEESKGGQFSRKVWYFHDHPATVDGKPLTVSRERETVNGLPSTKKDHQEKPRKKEAPAVQESASSILSKEFPVLDTIEFHEAWSDWLKHRSKKRLPKYTSNSQLKRLAGWGPDRAIEAINYCISQDYHGIHEEKTHSPGANQRGDRNRNAGTFNEGKSHLYAGVQRLAGGRRS